MVGGKVIGIARSKESSLVHVQDKNDTCSVRVVEKRKLNGEQVSIEIGDRIWWQAGQIFWTPKKNYNGHNIGLKGGIDYDVILPKIGYSH